MQFNGLSRAKIVCLLCLAPIFAHAVDFDDPFSAAKSVKSIESYSNISCQKSDLSKSFGLVETVNFALCNNPDTQASWVDALYQAERVGSAKAAYLPSLDASGSLSSSRQNSKSSDSKNAAINLSYLIYDFGARDANLQNANLLLNAANMAQSAKIQSLFLTVVQSYYTLFGAKASLEALIESQKLAKESYDAALARYQVGAATPADKLQALTAYSQATLNRVRAEGALKIAEGSLANTLGLDANTQLNLIPPQNNIIFAEGLGVDNSQDKPLQAALPVATMATMATMAIFEKNIQAMIDEAKKSRPDLAAAKARIDAAKADVDAAKASGKPTFILSSALGYSEPSQSDTTKSSSIGVSVNIPIFTGFDTTYKIRAAQRQEKLRELESLKLEKQVALEAYKAYNNLQTETNAVKAGKDLLNGAEQSMKTASGRYKAGVGNIIDLLTAQNALASAKQQLIEAFYNWYIAKATLAQSMGKLNFTEIENIGGVK